MTHKTNTSPANTNKGGAPKKLDKVTRVIVYLRKSVAHRWPRQAIEGLIERVESGEQVSGDIKPVSVAPKTQTPAPPLDKMAIARAALMGIESKVGLSTPTPLNQPLLQPFDTPVLDRKMMELWYSIDTLQDARKALVHRFIALMKEEQCNTQGISITLAQWQAQAS